MLFEARPTNLIKLIVHPVDGVVAKVKGVPTLREVNEWLDKRDRILRIAPPVEDEEVVEPEERARRIEMLKKLAQTIRETAKANCVGRPSGLLKPPKQIDSDEKRRRAMKNLHAINRGGRAKSKANA